MAQNWIKKAVEHKGALHRALGVKEGTKLTEAQLKRGEAMGGKVAKMVSLARTLKKMH